MKQHHSVREKYRERAIVGTYTRELKTVVSLPKSQSTGGPIFHAWSETDNYIIYGINVRLQVLLIHVCAAYH